MATLLGMVVNLTIEDDSTDDHLIASYPAAHARAASVNKNRTASTS